MPMNGFTKDDRALVARGYAVTANEATRAEHEMEVVLSEAQFRYERIILDLQSEFTSRRDTLRREHLERVNAISAG